MTVVFQKKPAKGVVSVSRKEEKEREQQQELNPQVTKAQKRVCIHVEGGGSGCCTDY